MLDLVVVTVIFFRCFFICCLSGNGDTQMCESEGGGNRGIQS